LPAANSPAAIAPARPAAVPRKRQYGDLNFLGSSRSQAEVVQSRQGSGGMPSNHYGSAPLAGRISGWLRVESTSRAMRATIDDFDQAFEQERIPLLDLPYLENHVTEEIASAGTGSFTFPPSAGREQGATAKKTRPQIRCSTTGTPF